MIEEKLSLEALLPSRAYLYEMLHKTFGGTPTAELLDTLSDKCAIDMADEYSHADNVMAELVSFLTSLQSKDESYLEAVTDEYTRLFIGPNRLPVLPWESPYTSGDPVFFQEATLLVREIYKAHGLKAKQYLHVPDDHISLMNGFMSQLAEKSLAHFRAGEYAELAALMAEQKAFIDGHLNRWLSKYAESLRMVDRTGFYATFAEVAAAFCKLDCGFIAEATNWLAENTAMSVDEVEALKPFDSALHSLKAVRLFGLEDNELKAV